MAEIRQVITKLNTDNLNIINNNFQNLNSGILEHVGSDSAHDSNSIADNSVVNGLSVEDTFNTLNSLLYGHIDSLTSHDAENITYNGDIVGADRVNLALNILKAEIDAIVTSGTDVDPRVSQALVDASGFTYDTLKGRLDTEYTEIKSELLAMSGQTTGRYLISDFTGANDTELIENAIAGVPDGGTLIFEPRLYDAGVNVNRSNINIILPAGCKFTYTFHAGIGTISQYVQNIRIYGTINVEAPDGNTTSGVGSYYCKNIYIESIISKNFKYGVHIYTGSEDVHIGTIDIISSSQHGFILDSTDVNYPVKNTRVGKIRVRDTNYANLTPFHGIYLKDYECVEIDSIDQANASGYGLYVFGSSNLSISKIKSIQNKSINIKLVGDSTDVLKNANFGKVISQESQSVGIDLYGTTENIEFISIESNNNVGPGITFRDSNSLKVHSASAKDNGGRGIEIENITNGQYNNLELLRNASDGLVMGAIGVNTDNTLNNVIANNNGGRGISVGSTNSINPSFIGIRGSGNTTSNNIPVGANQAAVSLN